MVNNQLDIHKATVEMNESPILAKTHEYEIEALRDILQIRIHTTFPLSEEKIESIENVRGIDSIVPTPYKTRHTLTLVRGKLFNWKEIVSDLVKQLDANGVS